MSVQSAARPEAEPEASPAIARAELLPTIDSKAFRTGRNLILGSVVLLSVARFFTEVVPVLPKAFNFVDIPLIAMLAMYLAVGLPHRPQAGLRPAFGTGITAFIAVCAISAVANLSRVEPMPAGVAVYGFIGPLLFYWMAYRLWPIGQAESMSKTILGLGIVQFVVVVVIDMPRFAATQNPDVVSGTFGENAYQLVIFLLVFGAHVTGLAAFRRGTPAARFAPVLLGASFLVIFLAQYRTLLVTVALTVVLIGGMISRARGRGFTSGILILLALAVGFGVISIYLPLLRFDRAVAALREDPTSLLAGKVQAGIDVKTMFEENPSYVLTGSGPGTYSSRGWRTFALLGVVGSHADPVGPYVVRLTGGKVYRTDVSERYVLPRIAGRADILGSRVLASPFSSYYALLAETGVVAFAILVTIYFTALSGTLRRAMVVMRAPEPNDPLPGLLLAGGVGLFVLVQAAFFDNWFEVARTASPIWILVGVTTKEYQARRITHAADAARRRIAASA